MGTERSREGEGEADEGGPGGGGAGEAKTDKSGKIKGSRAGGGKWTQKTGGSNRLDCREEDSVERT